MNEPEKGNLQDNYMHYGLSGEWGMESDCKWVGNGARNLFWMMEMTENWTVVMVAQLCIY